MASMALEIGRALRRARLARGLTLKQLAAASADVRRRIRARGTQHLGGSVL